MDVGTEKEIIRQLYPFHTMKSVKDLTEEEIISLVQGLKFLEEENQNLRGYVKQLQTQLELKKSQLRVANTNIYNIKEKQNIITIDTDYEERN
jgi:hypothetical protein